jgi:CheY-like chemotaxis protein
MVAAPHAVAGTRVLVVDDNPDVALAISYILEAHGYTVARVNSGKEALDHLRMYDTDVLLTDLYMPIMDGNTLLRQVRTGVANPPRVIALSGVTHHGREAAAQAATLLGAETVVPKPFRNEELLRAVRGGRPTPPGIRS